MEWAELLVALATVHGELVLGGLLHQASVHELADQVGGCFALLQLLLKLLHPLLHSHEVGQLLGRIELPLGLFCFLGLNLRPGASALAPSLQQVSGHALRCY